MVATVLACMGGIALGILSAVRQGWTDSVLGRAADALISIPHLMFALVVVAAFGTSLPVLILMAAISYVPGSYRFARALALDINAMDFVEVARARGEKTAYVVWAEILPNMIVPLLTDFGLRFVFVVLLLSGLSFLGLGIQPPNADWGALVRENITGIYEAAPAVLVPAIAIAMLTISITLLIDGFSRPQPHDGALDGALVEVSGLHVTAAGRRRCAERHRARHRLLHRARRGTGADRRIGLGQDHDRPGAAGLCKARLPHRRRQCAHRRRGGDDPVAAPSCRSCAAARVAYVAQSAAAAFNPSLRLMDQVTEGVRMRGLMPRAAAEAKARDIFRALALPEPDRIGARFPHQVSGGQLQRLMAAMALMTDPELVIFDEPTTALDVTTQVEVLRAFREAVRERHTTAVYVSHDLAVVAQIADRIVVLRDGAMRETGPTARILSEPADSYTKSLLAAAAPRPQQSQQQPSAARLRCWKCTG